jgi:hypothetical protein
MAILANIQALKDKIIASIKGASTNSSEKTKAIDHREVLTDVVDTLESLIPVAIDGVDGINGADGINGENGADGIDGIDGVGVPVGGAAGQALVKNSNTDYDFSWVDAPSGQSFYKTTVTLQSDDESVVINHNLNTLDVFVFVLQNSSNRKTRIAFIDGDNIDTNTSRMFFTGYLANDEFTIIVQKF